MEKMSLKMIGQLCKRSQIENVDNSLTPQTSQWDIVFVHQVLSKSGFTPRSGIPMYFLSLSATKQLMKLSLRWKTVPSSLIYLSERSLRN